MKNNFVIGVVISLALNFMLSLPSVAFSDEFKIVYPEKNEVVNGEVVEVEGTGAVPGAAIEVSVLTDDWYVQDGKAEINDDGSWTFAPCYLGGKGKYNNHTIKARLIQNNQSVATAKVRGIVRQD